MKGQRGNPGLKGQLLDRSVDAYVLALETINRLSVKYRVETFAYLICNAWELLLKAKVLADAGGDRNAIYYPKERGKPRRSLAVRDCLKRVFLDEKNPTRRNVERVDDLRNEAVHLVISQVPPDIMLLFQACVLNYHKRLVEWFGISLSERVPAGMMALVYDFSPEQVDFSSNVLRRQFGRETAEYLSRFRAEIAREFAELGSPAEFSIGIDYRLALVKKAGDADIQLTSGASSSVMGIVEVAKNPCKTHPYREKELIQDVNARLKGQSQINQHDVRCVVKVYRVKDRSEHFYQGTVPGSPGQYSRVFADWLLGQWKKDGQFFSKARQRARAATTSLKDRTGFANAS
jgi:hypothetical protein